MASCCRCFLFIFLTALAAHVTALPFAETIVLPLPATTSSSPQIVDSTLCNLKPKKIYKLPIRVASEVYPDGPRKLASVSNAEQMPSEPMWSHAIHVPSFRFEPCDSSCWQKEAGREVMNVVDCGIAGLGLTASLAILSGLEKTTGAKMFCAPMISSGVVFFIGIAPPNALALCISTVGAMAVYPVLEMLREWMGDQLVTGATAGFMLMWYRATNSIFVPATSLGFLIPRPKSDGPSMYQTMIGLDSFSQLRTSLQFLIFPWISGHSFLYLAALAVAWIRAKVRHLILSIAENGCSH